MNQTAVTFPVESIDNQPELIHSSIGELNQFSSSKLITFPDMPMNQPASATVRPKEKSSVPLNNKREDQSIQRWRPATCKLENMEEHAEADKPYMTTLGERVSANP